MRDRPHRPWCLSLPCPDSFYLHLCDLANLRWLGLIRQKKFRILPLSWIFVHVAFSLTCFFLFVYNQNRLVSVDEIRPPYSWTGYACTNFGAHYHLHQLVSD